MLEAEQITALQEMPAISETREGVRIFLKGLRDVTPRVGFRAAREMVRKLFQETEALLLSNQRAINALTCELTRRGTMSGEEVEAIITHYESPSTAPTAFGATTEKVLADMPKARMETSSLPSRVLHPTKLQSGNFTAVKACVWPPLGNQASSIVAAPSR